MRVGSGPRARPSGEEGTVLLLVVGLTVVALLLVVVVTDVSGLFLERRRVVAAADGAALAGAQAVDRAQVYREGLPATGPVPLDPEGARAAVTDYLAASGEDAANYLVTVDVTSTTVSVRVTTRYRLPISSRVSAGAAGRVEVSASATARTAVIP